MLLTPPFLVSLNPAGQCRSPPETQARIGRGASGLRPCCRISLTYPNGILATYAYNARDLTGITFTLGGNTLGTLTYTTDADGRRTLQGGTWARATLPPAITTALY